MTSPYTLTVLGACDEWERLYGYGPEAYPAPGTGAKHAATLLVLELLDELPQVFETTAAMSWPVREAFIGDDILAVAQHGDIVQYSDGPRRAETMAALIRIVAVLALQPGGVSLFGHHWCGFHEICRLLDAGYDPQPLVDALVEAEAA